MFIFLLFVCFSLCYDIILQAEIFTDIWEIDNIATVRCDHNKANV